jgi:hypothetical protein
MKTSIKFSLILFFLPLTFFSLESCTVNARPVAVVKPAPVMVVAPARPARKKVVVVKHHRPRRHRTIIVR